MKQKHSCNSFCEEKKRCSRKMVNEGEASTGKKIKG